MQHGMLHDVTLTASRKCLCEHTFSLRGIICLRFCLRQNQSGFAASALSRGCAIDGLAKMSVRAHIFASWYNYLSSISPDGAARAAWYAARCDIDGLAKMSVQAHIFASWYNLSRRILLRRLRGLCPQPHLRHGLDIDGLAKMFVQAHIFASWYNMLGILPAAKSKRLCRFRAFARRLQLDGRAKMPLQASIFASWLNCQTNISQLMSHDDAVRRSKPIGKNIIEFGDRRLEKLLYSFTI